jgi:hypothetical protein
MSRLEAFLEIARSALQSVATHPLFIFVALCASAFTAWKYWNSVVGVLRFAAGVPAVLRSLDPLVVVGCGFLVLLAFLMWILEAVSYGKLRQHIKAVADSISSTENNFGPRLEALRTQLLKDSNPRNRGFNKQVVALVDAIQPDNYLSRQNKTYYNMLLLDTGTAYRSALYSYADTLIRIALFITFATLTWALVNAASQMPDLGELGANSEDMAAQTSHLIRDLIAAASIKFSISAVGLALSIVLRYRGGVHEKKLSQTLSAFSEQVFRRIDDFLKVRDSTVPHDHQNQEKNINTLLLELIQTIRQNTEANREIAALAFSSRTQQ